MHAKNARLRSYAIDAIVRYSYDQRVRNYLRAPDDFSAFLFEIRPQRRLLPLNGLRTRPKLSLLNASWMTLPDRLSCRRGAIELHNVPPGNLFRE